MSKQTQYQALVAKRKQDPFFPGLLNPSTIDGGQFDCSQIGVWSRWHNDLDAKILLIGQDWGNEVYFCKNRGRDSDDNPTNKNLKILFSELGYELGSACPDQPFQNGLFFTNAVLGVKLGTMSAPVLIEWVKYCNEHYTKPLIEIIKPQAIICLGLKAYGAMQFIFKDLPSGTMSNLATQSFICDDKITYVFPRFHCGGLGLRNRGLDMQKEDWKKIKANLNL